MAGSVAFIAASLSASIAVANNPGGAAGPSPNPVPTPQHTGGSAPTAPAGPTGPKGTTGPSSKKPAQPQIAAITCVPEQNCSGNPHKVSVHGRLLMTGPALKSGMVAVFPHAYGAHTASLKSPTATLHQSRLGLVVEVPNLAHSGRVYLQMAHKRVTNQFGPIYVVRYALHPPPPPAPTTTTTTTTSLPAQTQVTSPAGTAFAGQGMWIWYISKSDGGSLAAIAAQAHASGVSTLFIKSSDGTSFWSQFTPALVATLHSDGLKVCAWQYVYGTHPVTEADLGAQAVADGADCLVIDAEAEYEGEYASAQSYIDELRSRVGLDYPVGLASFPYVNYHPAFPYSVFLGPDGAQYNVPQMYWKDIGVTVDKVFSITYLENTIYGRPIVPLGQTFQAPPASDLQRFAGLAASYDSQGMSWWSWQDTSSAQWKTLAQPQLAPPGVTPQTGLPLLSKGNQGDQVLWMQEHLATAIPAQVTSGVFDSQTVTDLEAFQTQHGISPSGKTDNATWAALLALAPVPVDWGGGAPSITVTATSVTSSSTSSTLTTHTRTTTSTSTPTGTTGTTGTTGAAAAGR